MPLSRLLPRTLSRTLPRLLRAAPAALLLAATVTVADDHESATVAEKLRAAMEDPNRPAAHRERDDNRKPVETLGFFGLADDMTVLELVPGGGWYTRLLAPVLREQGTLHVAIGTDGIAEGLLTEPGYEDVEVLPFDAIGERQPTRRLDVTPFEFGVDDVDLVLTFRNLHNFSETGRANMNRAAFEALKPGGHYGVVDHTRRHMQPDHGEVWRRMDPVAMIEEIQAVGFELVDHSDLHYRPDDELRYEVGRRTVTGNTDRFTLLFMKPE